MLPTPDRKKRTYSITPSSDAGSIFRGQTCTGTKMNFRKRSPSPVFTGKVSTFRNKFDNIPNNSLIGNYSTLPRTKQLISKERQETTDKNLYSLYQTSTLWPRSWDQSQSKLYSMTGNPSISRFNNLQSSTGMLQTNSSNKHNLNRAQL